MWPQAFFNKQLNTGSYWPPLLDITSVTVTIVPALGQDDPTLTPPINFTVVFSEVVTDFATGNVSFEGSTATGTLIGTVSGSGMVYNIAVTGMTGVGTIVVSIAADVCHDASGNPNLASATSMVRFAKVGRPSPSRPRCRLLLRYAGASSANEVYRMKLFTPVFDWAVACQSANLNTTDFPTLAPTAMKPDGNGVIELIGPATTTATKGLVKDAPGDTEAPNTMMLMAFGAGADNSTFDLRVTGWSKCAELWLPTLILQVTATLSTVVGVAGKAILATERVADALVAVKAASGTEVFPPTAEIPAWVLFDVMGFELLQVTANLDTATGANAIVKRM
jgi:hypothetical protein